MIASADFTLGVEEEYQIVDPETRELKGKAKQVVAAAQEATNENLVQFEMHRCQIETATSICQTLADVRREVSHARHTVITAAEKQGSAIAASGTHPFSRWQDQKITPKERYRKLAADLKQTIRELIIFGCHVHVGFSDRQAAVEVMNRARIWLAPLLALSANSPFWLGQDTGYVSYRAQMWSRLPTAGPPPILQDYEDHQSLVHTLVNIGAASDPTKIYWDIRLSERFPTIEFRVADVCLTVDETVMIAGLVRAIAQTCHQQMQDQQPYPTPRSEVLRAAQWHAARYGLDADLVDLHRHRLVPAPDLIEAMLNRLRPALEAQGDWDEVSTLVSNTLRKGNGAQRQRAVYQQTGRYEDVVDLIVSQTAQGIVQPSNA